MFCLSCILVRLDALNTVALQEEDRHPTQIMVEGSKAPGSPNAGEATLSSSKCVAASAVGPENTQNECRVPGPHHSTRGGDCSGSITPDPLLLALDPSILVWDCLFFIKVTLLQTVFFLYPANKNHYIYPILYIQSIFLYY